MSVCQANDAMKGAIVGLVGAGRTMLKGPSLESQFLQVDL